MCEGSDDRAARAWWRRSLDLALEDFLVLGLEAGLVMVFDLTIWTLKSGSSWALISLLVFCLVWSVTLVGF